MGLARRFGAMPSLAILLAVSGVVIIDAPPPRPANAALFGKICVVGEFEDGAFNTPTDLLTSSDQSNLFGLFGYRYGNQKYRYPCAKQQSGGELWNGNGWVQTAKLKFGALTFCRVDTSVGQVSLTPRAFVQGTVKAPFVLANGQTFIFSVDGGGDTTLTFAAAAATHTGSAGTFNSFVGGETLTLAIDDEASFTVIFEAADTSLAAIISRINTAYGQTIASNSSSQLKLTSLKKGTASRVIITAGAAATTLGLTVGTYSGTGDAADIALTTQAELAAKVDSSARKIRSSAAGFPRLVSTVGGSGTVQVKSGTANSALGFTAGATATTADLAAAAVIPAGTRLSDGGADATRVVTMQTTTIAAGAVGVQLLKVRPAVDDGTYLGAAIAAIDTLEDNAGDLEWSIGNPVALSAALTASQIDALYLTAIDACKGVGSDVTKRISGIVSARQSSAIRSALKTNAVDTSANGHYGRRAFICPPNGTSAAAAIASTAPGVGAYRAEEVSYCAGGVACFLQEMIDGGHSTDGLFTRHPDVMLASRWSVLTPGYNPGQLPEDPQFRFDATTFYGLESAASAWDISTYTAFKANGVCAAEFDKDTGIVFEQGITAVDPASDPSRTDISRKTLADFIGDSLAGFAKFGAKRQGTQKRREITRTSIEGFLDGLVGDTVEEYSVSLADPKSQPNHVVRWDLAVTPVQSDDVIVFNLSVGPNAVTLSRG